MQRLPRFALGFMLISCEQRVLRAKCPNGHVQA
jgi:hypothetical protein